ncbi:MAG: hypothetical protein AB198_02655 [Parcubacteria bacterium C7867-003]|nr:MAG: hypothetical protein AB198_02655 [Parcubacteria bacterium C7867-003]
MGVRLPHRGITFRDRGYENADSEHVREVQPTGRKGRHRPDGRRFRHPQDRQGLPEGREGTRASGSGSRGGDETPSGRHDGVPRAGKGTGQNPERTRDPQHRCDQRTRGRAPHGGAREDPAQRLNDGSSVAYRGPSYVACNGPGASFNTQTPRAGVIFI